MMLDAMATGSAKTDYVNVLDAGKFNGARIGVLRYAEGSNADIIKLFNDALADMQAAGATLVEIKKFTSQA